MKGLKFKSVADNVGFKIPLGGMQLYHPKYRDMPIEQVIQHSRIVHEYVPYGYTVFYLVRSTGIIHAFIS